MLVFELILFIVVLFLVICLKLYLVFNVNWVLGDLVKFKRKLSRFFNKIKFKIFCLIIFLEKVNMIKFIIKLNKIFFIKWFIILFMLFLIFFVVWDKINLFNVCKNYVIFFVKLIIKLIIK